MTAWDGVTRLLLSAVHGICGGDGPREVGRSDEGELDVRKSVCECVCLLDAGLVEVYIGGSLYPLCEVPVCLCVSEEKEPHGRKSVCAKRLRLFPECR